MPKRFPPRRQIAQSFRDLRPRQIVRLTKGPRKRRDKERLGIHESAREMVYTTHDADRDSCSVCSDALAIEAAVALDAACDAARLEAPLSQHVACEASRPESPLSQHAHRTEAAEHALALIGGHVPVADVACINEGPTPSRGSQSPKSQCRRRGGKSKPGNAKRRHLGLQGEAKRRHKRGPDAAFQRAGEHARRKQRRLANSPKLAICDIAECDRPINEQRGPPARKATATPEPTDASVSPPLGQPSPDVIMEGPWSSASSTAAVLRPQGHDVSSSSGQRQPDPDVGPNQYKHSMLNSMGRYAGGPRGVRGGLLWAITAADDDEEPVETLGDTQPFYRPPSPTGSHEKREACTDVELGQLVETFGDTQPFYRPPSLTGSEEKLEACTDVEL